jgi:hypothetical protein
MKIYVNGTRDQAVAMDLLIERLRGRGHTVADWREENARNGAPKAERGKETEWEGKMERWLESPAGDEQWEWIINVIQRSDLVIMVGPVGIDAWMITGMAIGRGVPVWGVWTKGLKIGIARKGVSWFGTIENIIYAVGEGTKGGLDK